jgi:hypothetical protein
MQTTGLPSKSAREIRSAKFEDDRATFEAARSATLQSFRTSKLVENLNSSSLAPVPGPVATSEHALSVSAFTEPLPAIATVLRDDESNRIASDHPVRPISSPLDFVRTISNRRGTSPVSEQVVEVPSAASSAIQADTDVHTTLPASSSRFVGPIFFRDLKIIQRYCSEISRQLCSKTGHFQTSCVKRHFYQEENCCCSQKSSYFCPQHHQSR